MVNQDYGGQTNHVAIYYFMENHPIPQDVTGFKFKLIGSITVKQFLYLLGFGILVTVVFILPLNLFIKIPFMTLFALLGLALAFVPIEGRPMDLMLVNFVRVIPSQNLYVYKKRGVVLSPFETFRVATPTTTLRGTTETPRDARRAMLLKRLSRTYGTDEEENRILGGIKSLYEEGMRAAIQKLPDKIEEPPVKLPQASPLSKTKSDTRVKILERELNKAREIQTQMQAQKTGDFRNLTLKIQMLEKELMNARREEERLAQKLIGYEVARQAKPEQVFKPTKATPVKESESVKIVESKNTLVAGFPILPDIPNIIMGIVKDARGKTLQNILVEVVDKNNIPVRAFKTNALGQFTSATPLDDGIYKVYFEDPKKEHEFQTIEITINGTIFNPLEIVSVDQREKLRQELFGNQMVAS